MPRSADLDTVAPDDISPAAPVVTDQPTSPKVPSKKKKVKKIRPSVIADTASQPHPSKEHFRLKINEIVGHTTHSLSAFLANPKVFTFEERDDGEEIILVLRRHWFTNVGWILITIAMVIAPFFFQSVPLLDYFPPNYRFVAHIFWYLLTFAYAFEQFLSWYFNVCIITDERVVDVDFYNILVKKFTDTKISMIQDVTSKVVGVEQTLFNFGTVMIQTASEIPEIIFEKIPNPEKVIKVLQQLRQEEEQEAIEGRIR